MLLTLFSRLVQFIVMFLTVRVMTTVLDPDEYGKVALITALTAFFAFFLINPVGTYINRHLNVWNQTGFLRPAFIRYGAYLLIVSIVAFCSVYLLVLSGIQSYKLTTSLSLLVAVTLFFATANQTLIPSLNILGQSKVFSWLTIGTAISNLAGAVLFTSLFYANAFNWLAGVVAGQAVLAVITWVVYSKSKVLGWRNDKPASENHVLAGRSVAKFALPVALSAGFVWLHLHGYRLVLGEIISLTELGLFAAGYTLAIQVMAAVELILNTWFQPSFYRSCDSTVPAVQKTAWSIYAFDMWLPSLLAAAAVYSGAPLFVKFMLGDSYQNTVQFVQFGALVELGRILVGVTGLYFHQHRQTNRLILPSAAGAIIAIVLVWFWVPKYGLPHALPALFLGSLSSFVWLILAIPATYRLSLHQCLQLLKGILIATLLVWLCTLAEIQMVNSWFLVWLSVWAFIGIIYLKMRLKK